MLYYWYVLFKIIIRRKFQNELEHDEILSTAFRVRLLDCDGLRIMASHRYFQYMDYGGWELIARSRLFKVIIKRKVFPGMVSQKIIYKRPIKVWTKFNLITEIAGWDKKWIYHVYKFEQEGIIKAIGVTKGIAWRKNVIVSMDDLFKDVGAIKRKKTPQWILEIFANDKKIPNL